MAAVFQVGDIVWARMKGFSPWPGKIIEQRPEVKKPAKKGNFVFVYFFGSNDCAWILAENVWQFREFKHKFNLTARPPKHFKEALAAAEDADSLRGGGAAATVTAADEGSLAAGSGTPNVLPSIEDELMQMFPDRSAGSSGTSSNAQPPGQQQPPPSATIADALAGTVNGKTSTDETPIQSQTGQTTFVAADCGIGKEPTAKRSRKRATSETRNGSRTPRTKANAATNGQDSSSGSSSSATNGNARVSKGRQVKPSKNVVAAVDGAGDVAAVDGGSSAKIRRASAAEGRSSNEATEAEKPVADEVSPSPRKRGRPAGRTNRNADAPERSKRVNLSSSKQPAQPSRPPAANSAEPKPLRRRAAAVPLAESAVVGKAQQGSSKTRSSSSSSSVGSPVYATTSILSPSRRPLGGNRGAGVAVPTHALRGSATARGSSSSTSVGVGSEPSAAAAHDRATGTKSPVTAWEAPQKGQLVGFLGLGVMGSKMARRLLNAGHQLLVWNRTSSKCNDVIARGARLGVTPEDVVCQCDITFSCVTDPFAVKELVFGDGGVLQGISPGKLFVDLSTIDVDTAIDISEAVRAKGGDFVEAPVVVCTRARGGDDDLADDVLMVAGSKDSVNRCSGHFSVMAGKAVHVGGVGFGARMKLCTSAVIGVTTAAVAESATLAEALGFSREDFFNVLCPTMKLFAKSANASDSRICSIVDASLASDFTTHFALAHQQKDLRLAIDMADMIQHPMPVTASANELYKAAMSQGLGKLDMSAIWKTVQHKTK